MEKGTDKDLEVFIKTEYIELDKLLKFCGFVSTGGEAKLFISSGDVYVDGEKELRRGRKIYPGCRVVFMDKSVVVKIASERMELK